MSAVKTQQQQLKVVDASSLLKKNQSPVKKSEAKSKSEYITEPKLEKVCDKWVEASQGIKNNKVALTNAEEDILKLANGLFPELVKLDRKSIVLNGKVRITASTRFHQDLLSIPEEYRDRVFEKRSASLLPSVMESDEAIIFLAEALMKIPLPEKFWILLPDDKRNENASLWDFLESYIYYVPKTLIDYYALPKQYQDKCQAYKASCSQYKKVKSESVKSN